MGSSDEIPEGGVFSRTTEEAAHQEEMKMHRAELAHYKNLALEWQDMANRLERALHEAIKLIEKLDKMLPKQ